MDLDEADKYKVEQKKQDMKEYILYHSPYIKDKHYGDCSQKSSYLGESWWESG